MSDGRILLGAFFVVFACLPKAGWTLLPEFIWLVSPYQPAWLPDDNRYHAVNAALWAGMGLVILGLLTGAIAR